MKKLLFDSSLCDRFLCLPKYFVKKRPLWYRLNYRILIGIFALTLANKLPAQHDRLFTEICSIVEQHFYDAERINREFSAIKANYQEQLADIRNKKECSSLLNNMLSELNTSHTYYLTPDDYEYYQLAAIFAAVPAIDSLFDGKEVVYPSIGVITERVGGQDFVACVLAGSEAEKAGLKKGDEVLNLDGQAYEPVKSLRYKIGQEVELQFRREGQGQLQSISVTPQLINPKEEMLRAEKASIRLIEEQGRKVGYIHIYSYAGREYHDVLLDAISWGALKEADALVIDLRYGLGGASPSYLNIFNRQVPEFKSVDKDGKEYTFDSQWRKPAVYLVNGKTRSGKELLAYGAKKYGLAAVIGEKTAGAVTAGRLFPLSNGDLLYLAVRGVLVNGEVLEGKGVEPDIEVPADIRYCKGEDVQLEKALSYLLGILRR